MKGSSWLDDILSELEGIETPRSWLWWSLIGAISAVAGNNYYLRTLGGKVIYKPNLYIMLLGSSGLGKGYGINLARLLVVKADCTRVIAGRSSIQAIVSELAKTKSNENGKPPMKDSRGFIVNGELSSAIISDVSALAILTDLYDGQYNPEWDNLLKVSGKEKLISPYITALFGSSQAHFYDTIPQANIDGGYIGRNLIVYEEKRHKDIDLLDDVESTRDQIDDTTNNYIVPKYVTHLTKIAANNGRILYNMEAKKIYNDWRMKWRSEQNPHEKTGFFNRVPDHVLKVAMCLCLSRYDSGLVITEYEINMAIEKVTGLIYANQLTSSSKDPDPIVKHTKTVLDLLIRADENQLTRKLLLNRAYPYGLCDTSTLDRIIDSLVDIGYVTKERLVAGSASDWILKLAGEPLIAYQQFLSQQSKGS